MTARHDAGVAAYRVAVGHGGNSTPGHWLLPVKYYDPVEHYDDDASACRSVVAQNDNLSANAEATHVHG